jgi:hypothetical protein
MGKRGMSFCATARTYLGNHLKAVESESTLDVAAAGIAFGVCEPMQLCYRRGECDPVNDIIARTVYSSGIVTGNDCQWVSCGCIACCWQPGSCAVESGHITCKVAVDWHVLSCVAFHRSFEL